MIKLLNIWNKIFMVKAVTAIEIHIVATEEWDVNMLDIKIKGSKVIFKNQFLCHNKNEFIEKIIPGKPVCLCVTGKGIYPKKLNLQKNLTRIITLAWSSPMPIRRISISIQSTLVKMPAT